MEESFVKVRKEDFVPSSKGALKLNANFFCIITQEVMLNKNLSEDEKLLYALITSLCHAKGYCRAQNSFFEETFEKSTATIKRWLANLKDSDVISIEYVIDATTNEQLERRIYPIMNINVLRTLAKNSVIGQKNCRNLREIQK